jgi:hypothetical protein
MFQQLLRKHEIRPNEQWQMHKIHDDATAKLAEPNANQRGTGH